jgi:hypothetical protein
MSLFTKFASRTFGRTVGFRNMSTAVEEVGGGAGGLAAAVGTTFVTYMAADYLSNYIQHPTQKVRTWSCT